MFAGKQESFVNFTSSYLFWRVFLSFSPLSFRSKAFTIITDKSACSFKYNCIRIRCIIFISLCFPLQRSLTKQNKWCFRKAFGKHFFYEAEENFYICFCSSTWLSLIITKRANATVECKSFLIQVAAWRDAHAEAHIEQFYYECDLLASAAIHCKFSHRFAFDREPAMLVKAKHEAHEMVKSDKVILQHLNKRFFSCLWRCAWCLMRLFDIIFFLSDLSS